MGATLLSLVQSAAAELGLPLPGAVVGATDTQTVQMYALMNAVGADLLSRGQWTALQTQAVINVEQPLSGTCSTTSGSSAITATGIDATPVVATPTAYLAIGNGIPTSARVRLAAYNPPSSAYNIDTPATATASGVALTIARDTYPVPADFVTFINDTQWDRGNHWRLQGPSSPQEDQWMRSGIVTTGPRRWFRQTGRGLDVFRIWPPPAASDVPGPLVYEYLSSYWAATSSGSPIPQFAADTDTCVFPDRLMIEGLKWRFFAAKGFDYSSSYAIWQRQVDTALARDGGAPVLNMARRRYPIFLSPANVQDGNFPNRP